MCELFAPGPFFDRNHHLFGLTTGYFHAHFYRVQSEIIGHLERNRHARNVRCQIIAVRRNQLEFRRLIRLDNHLQVGHVFINQALLADKTKFCRAVLLGGKMECEFFRPV